MLLLDKPRQKRLAIYPVGRNVTVAYEPGAPGNAVLEVGVNVMTYLEMAAAVAVAILGLTSLIF